MFKSLFGDSTPAGRRYAGRFLPCMGAYLLIFLVARPFAPSTATLPTAVRFIIALALACSVSGAVGAIMRYLTEETDEYLRLRAMQAVVSATGLTLCLTTLWGYLAALRIIGDLPAVDVFPVFSAAWLLFAGVRRLLGR